MAPRKSKVGDHSSGWPKDSLFSSYYIEVFGRVLLLSLENSKLLNSGKETDFMSHPARCRGLLYIYIYIYIYMYNIWFLVGLYETAWRCACGKTVIIVWNEFCHQSPKNWTRLRILYFDFRTIVFIFIVNSQHSGRYVPPHPVFSKCFLSNSRLYTELLNHIFYLIHGVSLALISDT